MKTFSLGFVFVLLTAPASSAFEFPGTSTSVQWSLVNSGRYLLAETEPNSAKRGVRLYFDIDPSSGKFVRSIRKEKSKASRSQICEFY